MDKKNIFVDAGIDVKKVSMRAPCRVRAELMLSESFDVLEMTFTTSSMTNLQRSAQAVSDMQYSAVQAEIQVSMLNSQLEGDPLSPDASPPTWPSSLKSRMFSRTTRTFNLDAGQPRYGHIRGGRAGGYGPWGKDSV